MIDNKPTGTKIIATLGPASSSAETLKRLLTAGVDVVRLNFSHGTCQDHQRTLDVVHAVREELDLPVPVMGDLCGPKIRVLDIEQGGFDIPVGHKIRIVAEDVTGNLDRIATSHPQMINDIEVGHRVLINDGAVRLRVIEKNNGELLCQCETAGRISNRKGFNLPDTDLGMPTLTDKDRADLAWAIEAELEYIALSFVRQASDVAELRGILEDGGSEAHVVSKIETRRALEDLDAIVDASDAVIVARGDLGVELDLPSVPRIQKEITERCRAVGTPVIVATQMLQSMVHSATPTRAEVSDVANAIFDATDAVLLSAETAVGEFPVETIEMLCDISREAEQWDQTRIPEIEIGGPKPGVAGAVADGLCKVAEEIAASAVVLWTETGFLARWVSKHRLDIPVYALTASREVQRRMALYYGIIPILADKPDNGDQLTATADEILNDSQTVSTGDMLIVGHGPGSLAQGQTGAIIIHRR